ncbi:MAG: lysylphosphatidylglycerol synthase transmembrane domain-containing protein [Thermoanaerobaculia bacterium]
MTPFPSAEPERRAGTDPLSHLGRRLLVPVLLAVAVSLGLALYADARELAGALGSFRWSVLVPVLGLTLLNYGLRFVRWHLYLRGTGSRLPWSESFAVFLAGLPLAITPGRAGELGKGWLVRELGGGRARNAVAVVLAERLVDALGFCVLIAGIGLVTPVARWVQVFAAVLAGATLAFLAAPIATRHMAAACRRVPGLRRLADLFEEVLHTVRAVLAPRALAGGLAVALVAWSAEAFGCALVVRSYAPQASWSAAALVFCVSSLLGGLSMLPGGLVVTEGALTVLLDGMGVGRAVAASATLITRASTLWFGVALGLLAIPWLWHRLRGNPVG